MDLPYWHVVINPPLKYIFGMNGQLYKGFDADLILNDTFIVLKRSGMRTFWRRSYWLAQLLSRYDLRIPYSEILEVDLRENKELPGGIFQVSSQKHPKLSSSYYDAHFNSHAIRLNSKSQLQEFQEPSEYIHRKKSASPTSEPQITESAYPKFNTLYAASIIMLVLAGILLSFFVG